MSTGKPRPLSRLRTRPAVRGPIEKFRELMAQVQNDAPPRVDGFGADAAYLEKTAPLLDFFFEDYFRVDMDGLDKIPNDGGGLIVANHAGFLPIDALMLSHGILRRHPAHRWARCMLEDTYMSAPFLSPMLTRLGMVRAHRENAARLLSRDHLVGVFPEGYKGALKPYSERYQLKRFGRGGFVKLAYGANVPLIPCAIIGAEEAYPMINNMRRLGTKLGIRAVPITLTFPLLGPLGVLPLPSKWAMLFGDPLDPTDYMDSEHDDIGAQRLKEDVRTKIQWMIRDLLARRESIWMG